MLIPSKHYQRNFEFMERIVHAKRSAGIEVPNLPTTPTMPDEKTRLLRAKLLLEETLETIMALGFTISVPVFLEDLHPENQQKIDPTEEEEPDFVCGMVRRVGGVGGTGGLRLEASREPNLVEIADGCGDVSVVNIGLLIQCGIDPDTILQAVDENNLAKFGPGHTIRDDGKLMKPPGHKPPDIAAILKDQGWDGSNKPKALS